MLLGRTSLSSIDARAWYSSLLPPGATAEVTFQPKPYRAKPSFVKLVSRKLGRHQTPSFATIRPPQAGADPG